jgi:hypothetical protein
MVEKGFIEFLKKNYRIEKGNQIICILNYFSNKLYVYEERFGHIEALAFFLPK